MVELFHEAPHICRAIHFEGATILSRMHIEGHYALDTLVFNILVLSRLDRLYANLVFEAC